MPVAGRSLCSHRALLLAIGFAATSAREFDASGQGAQLGLDGGASSLVRKESGATARRHAYVSAGGEASFDEAAALAPAPAPNGELPEPQEGEPAKKDTTTTKPNDETTTVEDSEDANVDDRNESVTTKPPARAVKDDEDEPSDNVKDDSKSDDAGKSEVVDDWDPNATKADSKKWAERVCPWFFDPPIHSGSKLHMKCYFGQCHPTTDKLKLNCCGRPALGGVYQCPSTHPYQCQKTTCDDLPTNCCVADPDECIDLGGLRRCEGPPGERGEKGRANDGEGKKGKDGSPGLPGRAGMPGAKGRPGRNGKDASNKAPKDAATTADVAITAIINIGVAVALIFYMRNRAATSKGKGAVAEDNVAEGEEESEVFDGADDVGEEGPDEEAADDGEEGPDVGEEDAEAPQDGERRSSTRSAPGRGSISSTAAAKEGEEEQEGEEEASKGWFGF